MGTDHNAFFAELATEGEEAVRIAVTKKLYTGQRASLAEEWLRRQDHAKAEAAVGRRDSREQETLEIARSANAMAKEALLIANEANRIATEDAASARLSAEAAQKQARWSVWAAVVAVVAVVAAARRPLLALVGVELQE